jgi:tetratricopeptide (TPR) repeat protein
VVFVIMCVVASVGVACADSPIESVATPMNNLRSEGGLGAGECPGSDRARLLAEKGRLDEAASLLDSVLACFAGLMTDPRARYVCVRDVKDLHALEREARATADRGRTIVRVDYDWAEALLLKAFVIAAREDWDGALAVLGTLTRRAPYGAEAHCELGYILAMRRDPVRSLVEYEMAVLLSERHQTAPTVKALALRGLGMALIELGRLDEAKHAYERSLKIDPTSEVARNELEYIEDLKSQENADGKSDDKGDKR